MKARHRARRQLPAVFWPFWWFVMGALVMAFADAVALISRCP